MSRNVLGEPLVPCSYDPLTGYQRDGCCDTDEQGRGSHLICARMTQAFLDFSRLQGNDLVTPRPESRFPGLKPGDRWCVVVDRWIEALEAGAAPLVVLQSTHERVLARIALDELKRHAWQGKTASR